MKFYFLSICTLFLMSCSKEMPISRANETIEEEVVDFSPLYFTKTQSGFDVNKNNLITNTNWIVTVDRRLTLAEISEDLQKIVAKKHKKGGIHEDHKKIYFVYSDTLNKRNAFVQFPVDTIHILNDKMKYDVKEKEWNIAADVTVEKFINQLILWNKSKKDTLNYSLIISK